MEKSRHRLAALALALLLLLSQPSAPVLAAAPDAGQTAQEDEASRDVPVLAEDCPDVVPEEPDLPGSTPDEAAVSPEPVPDEAVADESVPDEPAPEEPESEEAVPEELESEELESDEPEPDEPESEELKLDEPEPEEAESEEAESEEAESEEAESEEAESEEPVPDEAAADKPAADKPAADKPATDDPPEPPAQSDAEPDEAVDDLNETGEGITIEPAIPADDPAFLAEALSEDEETSYSVDVEWGAMTFWYVVQGWDAATMRADPSQAGWHVYDEETDLPVGNCEINAITVRNDSEDAELTAVFSYSAANGSGIDEGRFSKNLISLAPDDTCRVYFMPVTELENDALTDEKHRPRKIGTITVDIGLAPAD